MRSIVIVGTVVCLAACAGSEDGAHEVGATETAEVSEVENEVEVEVENEVEVANEVEVVDETKVVDETENENEVADETENEVETTVPELAVVAVLAGSEIGGIEAPIFCLYDGDSLDPRAPGIVGSAAICPLAASDFKPADVDPRVVATEIATPEGGTRPERLGWYIRLAFDAPLDVTTVETQTCDGGTCVSALADHVAQLTCGDANTPVALSGRYASDGSNTTRPPGPSLLLIPDPSALTFPTGTTCTLALLDGIADLHGQHVPADQRTYGFKLADLAVIEIDPGLDAQSLPIVGNAHIAFAFNASLDADSLDGSDFDLASADGTSVVGTTLGHGASTPVAVQFRFQDDWAVDRDPDVVELDDGAFVRASPYLTPGAYIARLAPGADIKERHGGALTATAGSLAQGFRVAYGLISTVPSNGAGVPDSGVPAPSAAADLQLRFGGELDPASVSTSDVELRDGTDAAVPFTLSVGTGANADRVIINPSADLVPGATYTLTIPGGAAFDWAGTCAAGADAACKTKMFAAPRVISFRVM